MKGSTFLTAAALILACGSGILFWQTVISSDRSESALSTISKEKKFFQDEYHSVSILNLDPFFQQRISKELIEPSLTLPQTTAYPYSELKAVTDYSKLCPSKSKTTIHSRDLQKALLWEKFICGQRKALPLSFFTTPPFMHFSGKSYALLAAESGKPEFSGNPWLFNHKNLFHLLEVLNLPATSGSSLHLSAWQLSNLIRGERLVLGDSEVLLVPSTNEQNHSPVYSVYPRRTWDLFMRTQRYIPAGNAHVQPCLVREGNVCWIENNQVKNFGLKILASFLFFAFLLFSILMMVLSWRRSQSQKRDAAHRLFTLQMLTHELRTPTTSIRLSLESLRKDYDELPEQSQKAFLRICEEVQRLDRVVDASKNYLSAENSNESQKNLATTPLAINEWVEEIVSKFPEAVQFIPLPKEKTVETSPYWLELCLRNLIDNAFHHGATPVTVELTESGDSTFIHVRDQGRSSFSTLTEMTSPFAKDQASLGLGLGLAIVERTMKTLGGELLFQPKPTTFTLCLKDKP